MQGFSLHRGDAAGTIGAIAGRPGPHHARQRRFVPFVAARVARERGAAMRQLTRRCGDGRGGRAPAGAGAGRHEPRVVQARHP